ncbi:MAG: adenylate/guanylate cyclase domain-containing protein [bacterium]|nr:adenylate/guanylate cyclase domain-containing protein [bacterium]
MKLPRRLLKVSDEVLFQKELQGTRLHLVFKGLLLLYLLGTNFTLEYFTQPTQHLGVLYLILLAVIGVLLWRIRHGNLDAKHLHLMGLTGLGIDLALICILPFAWYEIGGGELINRAYTLKTSGILVSIGLITVSGLALRPLYPALLSLLSFAFNLGLYRWVLEDPRVVLTSSYSQHIMGTGLNPVFFWINTGAILMVGALISLISYNFRQTVIKAVNLERANAQLGRYFSPSVAQAISGAGEDFFRPGGRRQPVAVMFCDLRNFTAMSETLPPEEVVQFLSAYHETMVRLIFEHGGTLDKFLGDGILATFGTPETGQEDLLRAVQCGLAMKRALAELNQQRQSEGKSQLGQGIGIHYGEAIVGNIGTAERLEYTVIGDTVNLASRIESACRSLGADFLVSQTVQQALAGQFNFKSMGSVEVKGQSQLIEMFAFAD